MTFFSDRLLGTLPPVLRAGACTASSWYTTTRSPACRSQRLQVRQGVEKLINGVQQRPWRHRFHPIAQHAITCRFQTCQPPRFHSSLKDEQDRELPVLRRAPQLVQELQAIVVR